MHCIPPSAGSLFSRWVGEQRLGTSLAVDDADGGAPSTAALVARALATYGNASAYESPWWAARAFARDMEFLCGTRRSVVMAWRIRSASLHDSLTMSLGDSRFDRRGGLMSFAARAAARRRPASRSRCTCTCSRYGSS